MNSNCDYSVFGCNLGGSSALIPGSPSNEQFFAHFAVKMGQGWTFVATTE